MLKRQLAFLLCLILLITTVQFSHAGETPITVAINGINVYFGDVKPVIISGSTLVPAKMILERLGFEIEWDDSTKTVTGKNSDKVIKLVINNINATINGKTTKLDVPAKIIGGRTMVPLRFIAESTGASVYWIKETKSVLINDNKPHRLTYTDYDNEMEFSSEISNEKYLQVRLPETKVESRGTEITLSFDENFPWAEKQYITDLFNYIYPLLVAFAGEPYRSGDMRVIYRPNEHTSLTPDISELHIGNLPNIRFGNDPGFNSMFVVETFHYFVKGTDWGNMARTYEYYAWSICKLISEYVYTNIGSRGITPPSGRPLTLQEGIEAYDDRVILGEVVYNGQDSVDFYNNFFIDQVSSMFSKLLLAESSSIDNLDFYKKFNSAFFKYSDMGNNNALEMALKETAVRNIEGMTALEWYKKQPYKSQSTNSDYAFRLLPVKGTLYHSNLTEDYNRLYIVLLSLKKDNYGNLQRQPITDAIINFKYYDKTDNLIYEDNMLLDMNSMVEKMMTYINIPEGLQGIPFKRVVASTTVENKTLSTELEISDGKVITKY